MVKEMAKMQRRLEVVETARLNGEEIQEPDEPEEDEVAEEVPKDEEEKLTSERFSKVWKLPKGFLKTTPPCQNLIPNMRKNSPRTFGMQRQNLTKSDRQVSASRSLTGLSPIARASFGHGRR